jgi:Predicted transcriptional regulators
MAKRVSVVSGVVLDEAMSLSLGELCRQCGISAEAVLEMVDEGLLEPIGGEPGNWRFAGTALWRAQMALRLTRDLRVNLAGAALALDLMDELAELRQRVRLLERQFRTDDLEG